MTSARKPPALALVVVLAVGVFAIATSAPLIRVINTRARLSGVGAALALAAFRMIVASCMTLPTAWPERRTLRRRAWPYALAAGLALALHFATWITSLSYTSMAASTAIVTTNPVWVTFVIAIQTRRLPSRAVLAGIAIALLGGLLIAWSDASSAVPSVGHHNRSGLFGDVLALVGALSATAYYLFTQRLQKAEASLRVSLGAVYFSAMLWLLPALPFTRGEVGSMVGATVIPFVILLGLLPQWVGHSAFHWAMQHVSPTLVTTVILLEPVGAALLAWGLFREQPPLWTCIGALVMLVGVVLVVRGSPSQTDQ